MQRIQISATLSGTNRAQVVWMRRSELSRGNDFLDAISFAVLSATYSFTLFSQDSAPEIATPEMRAVASVRGQRSGLITHRPLSYLHH